MTEHPTEHPSGPASATSTRRRWSWQQFFVGFAVAAVPTLLVLRTDVVPDSIGGLVLVVILGAVAVWHVATGRLRRDGPAFLSGLVLTLPLLAALFFVVVVGVFALATR